jgi:hypothetical protein
MTTPPAPDNFELPDALPPVEVPDMTRRIMGRLGYMHASSNAVRRARRQRWFNRIIGTCAMALLALGFFLMHQHSNAVRTPAEVTLPAAIGNDLQQQQHRIEHVIRTFQQIAPTVPATHVQPQEHEPADEPIDQRIDESAVAPVRWV